MPHAFNGHRVSQVDLARFVQDGFGVLHVNTGFHGGQDGLALGRGEAHGEIVLGRVCPSVSKTWPNGTNTKPEN